MTTLIERLRCKNENGSLAEVTEADQLEAADTIEALQAENAALKAEAETYPKAYGLLLSEWDALQEESDRLRQDRNLEKKLRKDSDERAHNAEAERDALAAKLVPLTNKQIKEIDGMYYRRMGPIEFTRAIEAAHGIQAKGGQHEDA